MLKPLFAFAATVASALALTTTSAAAIPLPVTPHKANTATPHQQASTPHNPRLKEILGEEDDASGPEAPTLSANCQQYVGKPNPYGPTGSNVDVINGDNVVSTGSMAGCYTAQNETTTATNPENPANIVVGANDYRVYNARESRNDSVSWAYTSMDGGNTWTDVMIPGTTWSTGAVGPLRAMDGSGDPTISFGPGNTVYYGSIAFGRGAPAGNGTEPPTAIIVNISHDGGLSWSRPHIIALDGADSHGNTTPTRVFNDKIWVGADPNSHHVYVTWTRFLDFPDGSYKESPIVISVSSDGGNTFSSTRRIDPPAGTSNPGLQPYNSGSNPQVAPDGTLYVAYEGEYCRTAACDRPTDRDVTVVAKSTDHGASFARSIVGTNYDFPFDEQVGDAVLTGEHFRLNSFPQLSVDPVTSQLLVTWVDDRNGHYDATGNSIRTNGDNIVSSSTDGITWTKPVAVGSAQDEIFGAVASYGGTAAVTSYTRHFQAGSVRLDYAYWRINAVPGRAVTAGPLTRITTQSSDPRVQFIGISPEGRVLQGVFIGDYTGVSMGADKVLHPAWTDFRGKPGVTTPNQDAYTDDIDLG
jgi:hypothetical protein